METDLIELILNTIATVDDSTISNSSESDVPVISDDITATLIDTSDDLSGIEKKEDGFTVDEDAQLRLSLSEENLIYLQKLELKRQLFEDQLEKRTSWDNLDFTMVENKIMFSKISDDKRTVIMQAEWNLLGQYGFSKEDSQYYFVWPWHLVGDDTEEQGGLEGQDIKIKNTLMKHTFLSELIKYKLLTFGDPMLISFIQAYLLENMPYEYVAIRPIANDVFVTLGLINIEWIAEEIEPSFG